MKTFKNYFRYFVSEFKYQDNTWFQAFVLFVKHERKYGVKFGKTSYDA